MSKMTCFRELEGVTFQLLSLQAMAMRNYMGLATSSITNGCYLLVAIAM